MSQLSEWSEVIQRVGDESDRKQRERVAAMREELPKQFDRIKSVSPQELIDLVYGWPRSSHDPNETEVWFELHTALQLELLSRLSK